jgi:hypothetical protein
MARVKKDVIDEIVEQAANQMEEELEVNVEDNELYPGGPTEKIVEGWKEQYGQVYMTETDDGEYFIWRTLARKEFKDIMKVDGADAMYREERMSELCVLWPSDYDFSAITDGKAGIPTILAEQIMERSGFSPRSGPIAL